MKLLVLGIGQPFRGDDGAGPEAVRLWQRTFRTVSPEHTVETLLLETPGLGLLDHLERADAAILVDAVSSDRPPGTVRVFPSFPETRPAAGEKTAHGFGAAETLALARKAGKRLPDPLILIGIEAQGFALGNGLSEPVQRAMPQAAAAIQQAVEEWIAGVRRGG
jgi:hydrogenase maturation protease